MTTVRLDFINHSELRINAEQSVLRELSDRFTFIVPNHKFMKAYKMGTWDGKIRLVNLRNNSTRVGMIFDIISYAKESNYKLELSDNLVENIVLKDSRKIIIPDGLSFEPRDFQLAAVEHSIKHKRALLLSATGSGKSFITYLIMSNIMNEINDAEGHMLIVVPSISLVDQLHKDFIGYAQDEEWVNDNVQKIYGGQSNSLDLPIVISTWQSLHKKPKAFYNDVIALVADEVHTFKADACSRITDNCTNARYKLGMTGTLQDSTTDKMMLKALFGPAKKFSSTQDLIDKKILADLKIQCVVLNHDKETIKLAKHHKNYAEEMSLLVANTKRNKLITRLSNSRKGNTLVLFQYVEKHGIALAKQIAEECPDKQVRFVYGQTKPEAREKVRELTEANDNVVIVASYGVFQQGVNIVNLDNVILASPSKSKIRVLQSIGRGLRRSETKQKCLVFDIADDLNPKYKTKNHTMKHFLKRYEYYMAEGLDVAVKTLQL